MILVAFLRVMPGMTFLRIITTRGILPVVVQDDVPGKIWLGLDSSPRALCPLDLRSSHVLGRISSTPPPVNSEFPEAQEVVCCLSCAHHMQLISLKGCEGGLLAILLTREKSQPCGLGRFAYRPQHSANQALRLVTAGESTHQHRSVPMPAKCRVYPPARRRRHRCGFAKLTHSFPFGQPRQPVATSLASGASGHISQMADFCGYIRAA
jgi:hypothetical protein